MLKTKEKLLAMLEENRGIYISGEEIAEKLELSRTSVWKAIASLRKQGYRIDAAPNKGYMLPFETDILSSQGIQKYLKPICNKINLNIVHETVSTNSLLKEKATTATPEGYVILSSAQTGGRGRIGRSFYSPKDTGAYMSILLRPENYTPEKAVKLTTIAALAVCEAIEKVSNKKTEIKWLNDIYMDGKKVSGILTEASVSLENGYLDHVITGIGVNIYPPSDGFPPELKDIAGSVFHEKQNDMKNYLTAEILNNFMSYYLSDKDTDYTEKYRTRSMIIGKDINVITNQSIKKATALDLDSDCRLIVQYEDGRKETLSSGEVSVRAS